MPKNKKIYQNSIKNWPKDDRPREKLFRQGEHTLSDTELLAILLRSGVKGETAIDLARKILYKFKTFRNMSHTDVRAWNEFRGLGQAKIAQIRAALEMGRRFREVEAREKRKKISSSEEVVKLFMHRMRDLKFEVFKIILLDAKNHIIDIVDITQGTSCYASPIIREVIHVALQRFSSLLICIHNHPSGDPSPSREDREFTQQLRQIAEIMDIVFFDHIIFGNKKYYSFTKREAIQYNNKRRNE